MGTARHNPLCFVGRAHLTARLTTTAEATRATAEPIGVESTKTMAAEKTRFQQRIESGKSLLIAEIAPPQGGDPAALQQAAAPYAGKVHALGISDNRDRVCMSALAAASLVAS